MKTDMNGCIFKNIYSDSYQAILGLNLKLVLWNQTNKTQRSDNSLRVSFQNLFYHHITMKVTIAMKYLVMSVILLKVSLVNEN